MTIKLLSSFLFGAFLLSRAASQTAPPVINYQGRLTQATGVVVPDGLTGMRVRIFATASGGSALWDSGDLSVATKSGTFSILLGSGGMPAMSPAVFAMGTVYVEVQPTGQAPLLPRQPIASVPWAFWATNSVTVIDDAITAAKLAYDPTSFAKISGGDVVYTPGAQANLRAIRLKTANLTLENAPFSFIDFLVTGIVNRAARLKFSTDGSVGRFDIEAERTNIQGKLSVNTDQMPTQPLDVRGNAVFDGRVGIGTLNPQAKLSLGGDGGKTLQFDHSGGANWAISTQADQDISLYARSFNLIGAYSGLLYCTNSTALKPGGGPWADLNSDRRLKTDISPMDNALRMLLSLRGVNYRFKDPEALNERPGLRRGFIAQEVETTFPEWVVTKPNGFKTVSFDSGFDALTVEAFREQQNQIENLRKENERLRRQNTAFESRLRSIEAKFKR